MVDTTALGEERSRFLTDHMNPVLHDLVTDVICHQPEDPLKFSARQHPRRQKIDHLLKTAIDGS